MIAVLDGRMLVDQGCGHVLFYTAHVGQYCLVHTQEIKETDKTVFSLCDSEDDGDNEPCLRRWAVGYRTERLMSTPAPVSAAPRRVKPRKGILSEGSFYFLRR